MQEMRKMGRVKEEGGKEVDKRDGGGVEGWG